MFQKSQEKIMNLADFAEWWGSIRKGLLPTFPNFNSWEFCDFLYILDPKHLNLDRRKKGKKNTGLGAQCNCVTQVI